jgi:hypothetical protein
MDMNDRLIRHKVRRTISPLTALTRVAASRDALCPSVVTSSKGPYDIYQGGHCPGKDFTLGRNAKPYVDRAIFERFTRYQLISHITALGIIQCYSKAQVLSLMDDCSAYVTPDIFRFVGENHMTILTFAPHTINIFQALNLPFFGVFKTKEKF